MYPMLSLMLLDAVIATILCCHWCCHMLSFPGFRQIGANKWEVSGYFILDQEAAHEGRPPDSDYSVYGESAVNYDVCFAVIDAVGCCHCYYPMLSLMLLDAVITVISCLPDRASWPRSSSSRSSSSSSSRGGGSSSSFLQDFFENDVLQIVIDLCVIWISKVSFLSSGDPRPLWISSSTPSEKYLVTLYLSGRKAMTAYDGINDSIEYIVNYDNDSIWQHQWQQNIHRNLRCFNPKHYNWLPARSPPPHQVRSIWLLYTCLGGRQWQHMTASMTA